MLKEKTYENFKNHFFAQGWVEKLERRLHVGALVRKTGEKKMLTKEQEKKVEVAYERFRWAAKEAERLFDMPLVVQYSGGKDSDVILQLAKESGVPFRVTHNLTTADPPRRDCGRCVGRVGRRASAGRMDKHMTARPHVGAVRGRRRSEKV